MKESTSLDIIMNYLPVEIRDRLRSTDWKRLLKATEIRFYLDRPVTFILPDGVYFLTSQGTSASPNNTACVKCKRADIDYIVDSITHYSFHAHINELKSGYIMLENGIRTALSGAYNQDGLLTTITGLSFRISRCIENCATDLFKLVTDERCGILICGGVNSGKTTILRDLCRLVGSHRKTTLIDERNEIACTANGRICNDVGTLTNVLSDCPRDKGIVTAVRNLSPDYIFCDEISTESDIDALMCGRGCGVEFCATVHADNMCDLMHRSFADRLISSGLFEYAVFLAGSTAPSVITEIRRLDSDDTTFDLTGSDCVWRNNRICTVGQVKK